jgi:hypothetical protein
VSTIRVVVQTSVAPAHVLAAARDFSDRRAEVFPAVSVDRLVVHQLGDASADATEGTAIGPFGANWERCRYDWSAPGSVKAPVTDSNVYDVAGSSWEIKASPSDSGSRVEMIWERGFRRNLRGILFGTAFRAFGKPIFNKYAREIIANIERLDETAYAGPPTEPG